MRHPSLKLRQFTVFLVDLFILYLSLYLVLVLRSGNFAIFASFFNHAYYFSFAFIAWITMFYLAGLYSLNIAFNSLKFATKLAFAVIISGLLTALFFYLASGMPISPKTVLFLFVAVSFILLLGWRSFYMFIMRLSPIRTSVGFIGCSKEADELINALSSKPYLAYDTAFLYDESCQAVKRKGLKIIQDPQSLSSVFDDSLPGLVVLGEQLSSSIEVRRTLFNQVEKGTRFIRLQEFYEIILRRIPVGVISEAWFLEQIDLRSKRVYCFFKRLTDIFVASLGLILFGPFWPIIALLVKTGSKGPVLFKQERIGRGNKKFMIYKFRTMHVSDDYSPTAQGDDRITGFGNFLRRTRLDELPQMVNILRGEMSFVGPRPERTDLALELEKEIPFYRQRHMIKPGVTGWDQVSGEYHSPSTEDTYKKLQYDLYYLKNMSIFLDVSIFFKTIMTVLSRSGR